MAVVSATFAATVPTEEQQFSPASMQANRELLHEDLQAGKSVSAVLVGIVFLGLLMMIITVLLSLRI